MNNRERLIKLMAAGQYKNLQNFKEPTDNSQSKFASAGIPLPEKSQDKHEENEIAIIGLACRFPGASSSRHYWQNLCEQICSITQVPSSRWDPEDYYHPDANISNKSHSQWAGLLDDIDLFDADFFQLSPMEAELMDPQQRIFLQTAWHAFEDAAYSSKMLAEKKCGVYVGASFSDYGRLLTESGTETFAQAFTGLAPSILAGRVAYLLNLKGPSLCVDTACSSSAVAIHLACQALANEECEMALAGGVTAMLTPETQVRSAKAGILSASGQCRAFAESADGIVLGEGVGAIVLKPLSNALADGDHVYCTIRGTGLNQDGKTNGITAPSSHSQTELELEVCRKAGVDPAQISAIETHGTGTPLGDPIEIKALNETFNRYTKEKQFCALGSVKGNIGHASMAAGIASIIKMALSFRYEQLPATLHVDRPNPQIDFDNSPFYLNKQLMSWPRGVRGRRFAAVSSFGFSGTNAHLILSDAPEVGHHQVLVHAPNIWFFSAKSPELLCDLLESFAEFIDREGANYRVQDIAYTLWAGRNHYNYRIGVVVPTLAPREGTADNVPDITHMLELLRQAKSLVGQGGHSPIEAKDLLVNAREALTRVLREDEVEDHDYSILAECYSRVGLSDLPWHLLFDKQHGARVSLPGYVFAREHFWVPGSTDICGRLAPSKTHDRNQHQTYPVNRVRESHIDIAHLTGTEFYLSDHRVQQRSVLPAVRYLEWAFKAVLASDKVTADTSEKMISLSNVTWLRPLFWDSGEIPVTLDFQSDGGKKSAFTISSVQADGTQLTHAKGDFCLVESLNKNRTIDLADVKNRCHKMWDKSQCYGVFARHQMEYGPAHQGIERLHYNDDETLAELCVPKHVAGSSFVFGLHPSLLDSALQSVVVLLIGQLGNHSTTYLPYAIEKFHILSPLPLQCFAYAKVAEESGNSVCYDILLLDNNGVALAEISRFTLRPLKQPVAAPPSMVSYFQRHWTQQPIEPGDRVANNTTAGCILLITDDQGFRDSFKQATVEDATLFVIVREGSVYERQESRGFIINPLNKKHYQQLFEHLREDGYSPEKIVYYRRPADRWEDSGVYERLVERSEKAFQNIFFFVQALLESKFSKKVRIALLHTCSVHPIPDCYDALPALVRTLRRENPMLCMQCLYYSMTEGEETSQLVNAVLAELQIEIGFPLEVRLAKGTREICLLRSTDPKVAVRYPDSIFKSSGCYLISGGAGGMGGIIARHLAKAYQARLILIGRSAGGPSVDRLIADIEGLGGKALYQQADITDDVALSKVIEDVLYDDISPTSLNGVIHCAGIRQDQFLLKQSPDAINAVLSPKLSGAINLHRMTRHQPLDCFVLCSSVAAVFGNPAQAEYSYANNMLGVFARLRDAEKDNGDCAGETVCIHWPLWKNGGMTVDTSLQEEFSRRYGIEPLSDSMGITVLEEGLKMGSGEHVVVNADPDKIDVWMQEGFYSFTAKTAEAADSHLNRQALREIAVDYLVNCIAGVTKHPKSKISPAMAMESFGVDSVMVLGITRQLESQFGELSKTLLFEYQTINELADYLVEFHSRTLLSISGKHANPSSSVDSNAQRGPAIAVVSQESDNNKKLDHPSVQYHDDIAIIGISGRYPGADNLEEFWQNLVSGTDSISQIPEHRWDKSLGLQDDNENNGLWGGFINDIDKFDPALFKISPREANLIDPQERLFLETVWRLLEDANYSQQTLSEHVVGVFVGVMYGEYQLYGGLNTANGTALSSSYASVANRVSYCFDFHGPSMALDTMCSSSLTSIHLACESIRRGECNYAVAGGVNLSIHPNKYLMLGQNNFLSSDGRCRSFGEGGDGYVPGEGVGAVMLKSYREAIADDDHIHAVIKASAVNHGGKTNGYSVPNPKLQSRLIRDTWQKSGIDPNTIGYLEAHGTGTSLGDPIEINALAEAFSEAQLPLGSIPIGSVKSNIGHLEAAAGIAGVTKLVLQLKHAQLVPSLHANAPNPLIDFANLPFSVNTELRAWSEEHSLVDSESNPLPRRTAISSFGAGGSNAHIILEQAPLRKTSHVIESRGKQLIVLSAKSLDALRESVHSLIGFVSSRTISQGGDDKGSITFGDYTLANIAFTLQVGRTGLEQRLAVVAESAQQLCAKLEAWLTASREGSSSNIDDCWSGNVYDGGTPDLAAIDFANIDNLSIIAQAWLAGSDIKWRQLYQGSLPRRVALPPYPMTYKSYWFDDVSDVVADKLNAVELPKTKTTPLAIAPIDPAKVNGVTEGKVNLTLLTELAAIKSNVPLSKHSDIARADMRQESLSKANSIQDISEYSTMSEAETTVDDEKNSLQSVGPLLCEQLASSLFLNVDEINPRMPFVDLGLDSVVGVEWVGQINKALRLDIKAAKLYDYANLELFTDYVDSVLKSKHDQELASGQTDQIRVKPEDHQQLHASVNQTEKTALEKIKKSIADLLADVLLMDVEDLNENMPLVDMGLDSVVGVEWIGRINQRLKLDIKAAKLYDYPTLGLLSDYIVSISGQSFEVEPNKVVESPSVSDAEPLKLPVIDNPPSNKEYVEASDVAIIGIACRFPGADNPEEFWQNIRDAKVCISEVSPLRWDWRKHYDPQGLAPDKTYSKWGGFIDDVAGFDAKFFNLSPQEARLMDPQQRLFLQEAWRAIEDAGYSPAQLDGANCGVYLGGMHDEYSRIMERAGVEGHKALVMLGNSVSMMPTRISYHLNFKGPTLAINTACSSSLVAMHLASEAVARGEVDMALTGGVSLYLDSEAYIAMSQAEMLSRDGRCFSFDDRANGFVPGEGVAALLLKRLDKAETDGDHIYGIIKGSATNQDGRSNGITAPSGASQKDLEAGLYREKAINPQSLGYVEAHGTATPLGDPIEVEALSEAFSSFTDKKQFCAIGSVKSNIGHTSAAAGAAGVIKVLMAMKYQQLPPTANYDTPNRHIDFDGSPFYVNTHCKSWLKPEDGQPRRAAVSSFGFSGTNAHLILQESPQVLPRVLTKRYQLVVLSAIDEDALHRQIHNLSHWIVQQTEVVDDASLLNAVAYTLLVGRDHMARRFACVVDSLVELKDSLQHFLQNGIEEQGVAINTGDILSKAVANSEKHQPLYCEQLELLAAAFRQGKNVDYHKLFDTKPARLSLPTYAFSADQHWFKTIKKAEINEVYTPVEEDGLPPLSHSLLTRRQVHQDGITATFHLSGNEFFVGDHLVNSQKVLPGAVLLEMARVAATVSNQEVFQLSQNRFHKPLEVSKAQDVIVQVSRDNDITRYHIFSDLCADQTIAQGVVSYASQNQEEPPVDLSYLRSVEERCERYMDSSEFYGICRQKGLEYGPQMRAISVMYLGENEVLAQLTEPKVESNQWGMHPSVLDSALQSVGPLLIADTSANREGLYLPTDIGKVRIFSLRGRPSYVHATRSSSLSQTKESFDLRLLDESGTLLIEIQNYLLAKAATGTPELGCFTPVWKSAPAEQIPLRSHGQKVWLLFDNDHERVNAIRSRVRAEIICIEQGEEYARLGKNHYQVIPDNWRHYQQVFQALSADDISVEFILHNWCLQTEDFDPSRIRHYQSISIYSLYGMYKAMAVQALTPAQLIFSYCDSTRTDLACHPVYVAIEAFLRVVREETVGGRARSIGWMGPPQSTSETVARLLNEIQQKEDSVRYRLGQRFITDFVSFDQRQHYDKSMLKPSGVYVITGAMGAIGKELAIYLATNYQAHLLLLGRSASSSQTSALIDQLHGLGALAVYVQADVSDLEQLKQAIALGVSKYSTFDGVFHCAGLLDDSLIINKRYSSVQNVLAAKIQGVTNLDIALSTHSIDFFVLFSSVASVMAIAGQADYSFANGFMDNFCQWREAQRELGKRHGVSLSLNWPLWDGDGMGGDATTQQWFRGQGVTPLPVADGLGLLEQSLSPSVVGNRPYQIVALYGELDRITRYLMGNRDNKVNSRDVNTITPEARRALEVKLLNFIERETQYDDLAQDPGLSFDALGLESIMIINIIRQLEQDFGPLPKTLFYEYKTVSELALYLLQNHQQKTTTTLADSFPPNKQSVNQQSEKLEHNNVFEDKGATTASFQELVTEQGDIAIIGLAGRYPMASTLEQFWENLAVGKDCVTEIPPSRWGIEGFYSNDKREAGKSYSKWGGFIDGIDQFDPLFFNISPREAVLMDPQERIFLETSAQVLEDAGYTRYSLQADAVGVFVGVMWGHYQLYGAEPGRAEKGELPGSSYASVANRVSYTFDFNGPSVALDTMCSSSLSAIHLACQSIHTGESDVALAGGVNICSHRNKYLQLSQGKFVSSDGKCRAFGEGGEGYVPGEGCGAVLLKPLARAITDGDHIYGVIKGTAINHGGRSNGYSVPSPNGQTQVIKRALDRAGVNPDQLSYVEAHGTGTALGDPIEIAALSKAVGDTVDKENSIAIGSVKSNIGHLESAAGIAGLSKILMQLKHSALVPSLHANRINPNIEFDSGPFYVQTRREAWQSSGARYAALSSFGAGGANGHIVVSEHVHQIHKETSSTTQNLPSLYIFVLSAKTPEALHHYANDMLTYIRKQQTDKEDNPSRSITTSDLSISDRVEVLSLLQTRLQEMLCQRLCLNSDVLDPEEALSEYGLSTADKAALQQQVQQEFSVAYDSCIWSDEFSLLHVSTYIADRYLPSLVRHFKIKPKGEIDAGAAQRKLLNNMTYTLQVGREAFVERLALIVASLDELSQKLQQFCQDENSTQTMRGCFRGNLKRDRQKLHLSESEIAQLLIQGDYEQVARDWSCGANVNWQRYHSSHGYDCQRQPLPTYPFEREPYWVTSDSSDYQPVSQPHIQIVDEPLSQPQNDWSKREITMDNMQTPAPFGPFQPLQSNMLQTAGDLSLSERKQQYIQAFSQHICQKYPQCKAHTSEYREPYADYRAAPFFHMSLKELCFAIVPSRAEGAKLWDIDGNQYVDLMMDFGANLFGHQPAFLKQAMFEQINRGIVLPLRSEKAAQAAKLICDLTGNDRAAFVQSGSEAVMTALRLARHTTRKKKIVIFSGSYHGLADAVLVRKHTEDGREVTRPVISAIPQGMVEDVEVLDYDDASALQYIKDNADTLAAILVEPVQSRNPKLQPREFLHALREITSLGNIALIFDEIITGFRSVLGGAQEWFGVRADIVTYGKVVGSGMPIGVVSGTSRFMDAVDGGQWQFGDDSYPKVERTFFGGTHSQNPLAMACIEAVMSQLKIRGNELQSRLNGMTADLADRLNRFFKQQGLAISVMHFSSLFRLDNSRTNLLEKLLLQYHLWDKGILLSDIGNNFLSDAHTPEDIDKIVEAFQQSVFDLKKGGFFEPDFAPLNDSDSRQQTVVTTASEEANESAAQDDSFLDSLIRQLEQESQ